eukprot:g2416.t1
MPPSSSQGGKDSRSIQGKILAGAVSGGFTSLLLQPFDRLKTLYLQDVWDQVDVTSTIGKTREGGSGVGANHRDHPPRFRQKRLPQTFRSHLISLIKQDIQSSSNQRMPILALWRGARAATLRVSLGCAVYLPCVDLFLIRQSPAPQSFSSHTNSSSSSSSSSHESLSTTTTTSSSSFFRSFQTESPLLAGAMARVCATCLLNPITLVKLRLEATSPSTTTNTTELSHHQSSSSSSPLNKQQHKIYRSLTLKEDIGSVLKNSFKVIQRGEIFTGLFASLLRDAPSSAIYVATYEALRSRFVDNQKNKTMKQFPDAKKEYRGGKELTGNTRSRPDSMSLFAIGAFSATIATTLTTPFDVLKTHVQLILSSTQKESHQVVPWHNQISVTARAAEMIWQKDGFLGFFRGLPIRLAKRPLQAALVWTMYENIVDR